ncbi:MAG: SH3 domain-containing protein [Fibrobacterales bacterium]
MPHRLSLSLLLSLAVLLLSHLGAGPKSKLPPYIFIVQENAYLREGPHENAPIKAALPFGTRFKVISKTEEWYQVKSDNIYGHISEYDTQYLKQMDSKTIQKLNAYQKMDFPMVEIREGDTIAPLDTISIIAIASDGLGEITQLEWKIGNGPYVKTNRTDTIFIAPNKPTPQLPVILRARDNSGLYGADTAHFVVK